MIEYLTAPEMFEKYGGGQYIFVTTFDKPQPQTENYNHPKIHRVKMEYKHSIRDGKEIVFRTESGAVVPCIVNEYRRYYTSNDYTEMTDMSNKIQEDWAENRLWYLSDELKKLKNLEKLK